MQTMQPRTPEIVPSDAELMEMVNGPVPKNNVEHQDLAKEARMQEMNKWSEMQGRLVAEREHLQEAVGKNALRMLEDGAPKVQVKEWQDKQNEKFNREGVLIGNNLVKTTIDGSIIIEEIIDGRRVSFKKLRSPKDIK